MGAFFKVGDLVILETGEYSDRSWHGPFRALKDFNIREAAQEFQDGFKPEDEWDRAGPHEFVAWLSSSGYLEEVDAASVHVGSYGSLEIDA